MCSKRSYESVSIRCGLVGPTLGGVLSLGILVLLYFGFGDVVCCVGTVGAAQCGGALMVFEIFTLGNCVLVFYGSGNLRDYALVFGGFNTFGSCAVFADVVACPKIYANFESVSGLVLPMGGKGYLCVGFWMACMRSCAEFVAASANKFFFNCCVGKNPQVVLSVLLWFWGCGNNSRGNDRGNGIHNNFTFREDPMLCGQLEFHALILL